MNRNEIIIRLIDERLQEILDTMNGMLFPHLTDEETEEFALLYLEREEQVQKGL